MSNYAKPTGSSQNRDKEIKKNKRSIKDLGSSNERFSNRRNLSNTNDNNDIHNVNDMNLSTTIEPIISNNDEFNINVYINKNKTISLSVKSSYIIEKVKEMISISEDIPVNEQMLFFACYDLNDSNSLLSYHIQVDCVIYFVEKYDRDNMLLTLLSNKLKTLSKIIFLSTHYHYYYHFHNLSSQL